MTAMAQRKCVSVGISAAVSLLLLVLLPSGQKLRNEYAVPSDFRVKAKAVDTTTNAYDTNRHWFGKNFIATVNINEGAASSSSSSSLAEFLAREWHEYWTYASRKGIHNNDVDQQLLMSSNAHLHDEYVESTVKSLTGAALQHIDTMKRRYINVGALPDFRARGIGWIWERLNMVLTIVVAGDFADHSTTTTTVEEHATVHLHASGPATIFIVDTIGEHTCGTDEGGDSWIDVQPPLTMWVRVHGMLSSASTSNETDIFAGTALPHKLKSSSHRCTWRYDFVPTKVGVYSIHVKVLNFNGFVDIKSGHECTTLAIPNRSDLFDRQNLNEMTGDTLEQLESMNYEFVTELAADRNYSHHRGVSGFKLYDPVNSCCEACKRSRGCKMFSIPGAHHFDECELYFDSSQEDIDFLDDDGVYLGRDRNYSYVRQLPANFPSIRRRLVIPSNELKKAGRLWPVNMHPIQGFPPVGIPGGVPYFIGCGWSSILSFESPCHYPSDDLVFRSGQKIKVVDHRNNAQDIADDGLRACLLNDERLDVSNGRWVRYPYPDDSACPLSMLDRRHSQFNVFRLQYFGDADPLCWYRDDNTQIGNTCAEPGCQFVVNHRWVTDLKRVDKWYGWWKQYNCDYRDMGDSDIQKCIDRKQISSIEVRGASLKGVVEAYLFQKLQDVNLSAESNNVVIIDTLKMPHIVWHDGIEEHRKNLETFANVSAVEYYFLTGFYYTSEREPHVQVDRSLQFSKMAYDILTPKGYRMINAFDVTAAFAYDTDGQADGLHIGGPPIRAIVTKFFHHLCHEILLLSDMDWKTLKGQGLQIKEPKHEEVQSEERVVNDP